MNVNPGTNWLFLGGEDGFNVVHRIVEIDLETDPKMPWISSWHIPKDENDTEGEGWTWRGPLNLFVKSFKPLGPADEAGV